jgi:hypothetical protein
VREELLEVMEHPGFPALMAELERVLSSIQQEVIRCSDEDPKLPLLKSRAVGADKLVRTFKARLESLKPKQER